jgi:ribosomal protein L21E
MNNEEDHDDCDDDDCCADEQETCCDEPITKTESPFKKGQKVRIVNDVDGRFNEKYVGQTATVVEEVNPRYSTLLVRPSQTEHDSVIVVNERDVIAFEQTMGVDNKPKVSVVKYDNHYTYFVGSSVKINTMCGNAFGRTGTIQSITVPYASVYVEEAQNHYTVELSKLEVVPNDSNSVTTNNENNKEKTSQEKGLFDWLFGK